MVSGLYDKDNNLMYTWEELKKDRVISIANKDTLMAVKIVPGADYLRIDDSIHEVKFVGKASKLTRLYFPEHCCKIAPITINYETYIRHIEVHSNNQYYHTENGVLFSKDKTQLIRFPFEIEGMQEYIVPDTVKSIRYDAFCLAQLQTIKLHENIEEIEEGAFASSKIEYIKIPSSVIEIKNNTFYNCKNLKKLTLSNALKFVETEAFDACYPGIHINYTGTQKEFEETRNMINALIFANILRKNRTYEYKPTLEELIEEGKNLREINRILKNKERNER